MMMTADDDSSEGEDEQGGRGGHHHAHTPSGKSSSGGKGGGGGSRSVAMMFDRSLIGDRNGLKTYIMRAVYENQIHLETRKGEAFDRLAVTLSKMKEFEPFNLHGRKLQKSFNKIARDIKDCIIHENEPSRWGKEEPEFFLIARKIFEEARRAGVRAFDEKLKSKTMSDRMMMISTTTTPGGGGAATENNAVLPHNNNHGNNNNNGPHHSQQQMSALPGGGGGLGQQMLSTDGNGNEDHYNMSPEDQHKQKMQRRSVGGGYMDQQQQQPPQPQLQQIPGPVAAPGGSSYHYSSGGMPGQVQQQQLQQQQGIGNNNHAMMTSSTNTAAVFHANTLATVMGQQQQVQSASVTAGASINGGLAKFPARLDDEHFLTQLDAYIHQRILYYAQHQIRLLSRLEIEYALQPVMQKVSNNGSNSNSNQQPAIRSIEELLQAMKVAETSQQAIYRKTAFTAQDDYQLLLYYLVNIMIGGGSSGGGSSQAAIAGEEDAGIKKTNSAQIINRLCEGLGEITIRDACLIYDYLQSCRVEEAAANSSAAQGQQSAEGLPVPAAAGSTVM